MLLWQSELICESREHESLDMYGSCSYVLPGIAMVQDGSTLKPE